MAVYDMVCNLFTGWGGEAQEASRVLCLCTVQGWWREGRDSGGGEKGRAGVSGDECEGTGSGGDALVMREGRSGSVYPEKSTSYVIFQQALVEVAECFKSVSVSLVIL
ncbi:hypothetical protein E2C01_011216 [Portunus trituberculatus]|uniref:Uncharacterized protein n=1 Tax=Portunus trituberculatus TaxID=210409 RepID=A0A5B7DAQ6_PORTR|nr:hypothetical protein [Portunus trituberculatus]